MLIEHYLTQNVFWTNGWRNDTASGTPKGGHTDPQCLYPFLLMGRSGQRSRVSQCLSQAILEVKSRALCLLDKHSPTEHTHRMHTQRFGQEILDFLSFFFSKKKCLHITRPINMSL